ncbi:YcnI family protein [Sinomonas sp. R1AF57]|uniref:YcnI family protein n=1 Tax=Sinomonas sp. R1AF57 TaxID=2020377 RepID=UPI000B5F2931|nr:YcnI family protein [Sinomonas sp. R1AF57]ASN50971.1 nuclear export factor GLE1 [Sinomonas sp. R1AF57]
MNASPARRALRTLAPAALAGGLLLAGAGAAAAHVGITPSATDAGSSSLLTVAIPHGCGESPTTKVAISLPAELVDAQPTVNPNWTVEKVTQKLGAPQKLADGSSVTERTAQVVYTAKAPLEAHLRDTLVLSVKLPVDAAGKTLYFPTLQTCEAGQTDWKEIPAEGQDPHGLKAPAPSVTVTAPATATASGHDGHGSGADAAASVTSGAAADPGSGAAGWAGLVAGLLGLVMGGLALLRTRSRAS